MHSFVHINLAIRNYNSCIMQSICYLLCNQAHGRSYNDSLLEHWVRHSVNSRALLHTQSLNMPPVVAWYRYDCVTNYETKLEETVSVGVRPQYICSSDRKDLSLESFTYALSTSFTGSRYFDRLGSCVDTRCIMFVRLIWGSKRLAE